MSIQSRPKTISPEVFRSKCPTDRLVRRLLACSAAVASLVAPIVVSAQTITVDATDSPRGNPHFWSACVGTGTASLTLRSDLQTHYKIGNRELGMQRVRGHGVLNDDMGIYIGPGNYDWTNFDVYLDAIVAANMRPLIELSFMPTALARSGNDKDPPGDANAYSDFIGAVVQHSIDRYGADDVGQWYWEVWNEYNYSGFWTGTEQDYFEMYDAAAIGATAVLPNILIGGPATTSGSTSQMAAFLDHVAQTGSRVTFLSSHVYAGGGADGPTAIATVGRNDNDSRVGVIAQAGLSSEVKSFNTEWNSSYSGQGGIMADNIVSMDSHANAPFVLKVVKLLADQVNGNTPPLDIFSYWVISDVFDESSGPMGSYILGHDGIPFGQVFGMMNFQGLRKAAFNAFKMLNYLGPEQLAVSGGSGDPDGVDGMASISADGGEVAVIVYNYYATVLTSGSDSVTVNVDNLPFAGEEIFVTKFVIDSEHSNPYGVWLSQGSPVTPSEAQWQEMRAAQHLALAEPVTTTTASTSYSTTMDLPRQGAALILLSRERPLTGRDALVEMEGEDYDGQSGATKEDSNDESLGQSITLDSGGSIFFLNVDFRDTGVDSLALRVSAQSDTTLELHADTQDGTLIGTCSIAATSGSWATQMCDLTLTTGVHTLYLVATDSLRLNWMKFGAGNVVVGTGGTGGTAATTTTTTDASTSTTTTTTGSGGTAGTSATTVTGSDTTAGTTTAGMDPASCQAPLQLCSGVCVDTNGDAANCRGCGVACREGQVCSAGICSETCAAGLTQCGQNCVDLMSSLLSCGTCGLSCGPGQSCESGACVGGPGPVQPSSSDEGGCGCRFGPQRNGRAALLFGLLSLGLLAGRRRDPRFVQKTAS